MIAYDHALRLMDKGYMPLLVPAERDGVPSVILASIPLGNMGRDPLDLDVVTRSACVLGAMLAAHQHLSRNGFEVA